MAQGKQQKKKNYIIRNPARVMKRFYDGFNHKYLYRKAQTLMFLVSQQERFTEMVKQAEATSTEDTPTYLSSQDIDDKYFEGLRAEVYFTEMHQFESFFALLIAYFHELPDWLYLRTYTTEEIKTAIQNYVDGNFSAVTKGRASTCEEFIIHAVYTGYYSEELRENTQWNESVDSIDWFIKRAAKRYLEAIEYNAYKHGLRVLTGRSALQMAINPQGPYFVLGASDDSLFFPELEDQGEGGLTAIEVTKHFNPKESFEYVQIMQFILDEVMRTRRARIHGENLEEIQTIIIDRARLHGLRKYFTFSLTV
jgi:hypothetical protein